MKCTYCNKKYEAGSGAHGYCSRKCYNEDNAVSTNTSSAGGSGCLGIVLLFPLALVLVLVGWFYGLIHSEMPLSIRLVLVLISLAVVAPIVILIIKRLKRRSK